MTTPAPSVPSFLAGFGPQQSDMQSLWVNPAAFFQQKVVFRATQTTTATTLPSMAVTRWSRTSDSVCASDCASSSISAPARLRAHAA